MEKSKKNAKILIVFACIYAVLCIFGSSINYAVDRESFGYFLSDFISSFYGVFVFAMAAILFWAIRVLKGQETVISEKVMAWLLAAVFTWVFLGSLSYYINLITNEVTYTYNTVSDYQVGSIAINVLWTLSTIGVFFALKFQNVIGAFFKGLKGGHGKTECDCGCKECDAQPEAEESDHSADADEIK